MKILLAVDDDAASYEAALVVADWFDDDTDVVVLHVGGIAPTGVLAAQAMVGSAGYPVVALPVLRSEGDRLYREARDVASRAADLTDGSIRTEAGDPATTIVEVAAEIGADLIAIGCGDRSWLSKVVTPSVSAGVIDRAPCPVLVVPESALAPSGESETGDL